MILSIDNKPPTEEELKIIRETKCMKCGEHLTPLVRTIFVNLGHIILWWHGTKYGRQSRPLCSYRRPPKLPPVKIQKNQEVDLKCPTCKTKIFSHKYFPYCSKECRFETVPSKLFLKEFLVIN